MDNKENLKETLLAYKRDIEETWRYINGCIVMEEEACLSGDKEKAIPKLKRITDLLETMHHLCFIAMVELEESTTDFTYVKLHSKEIEHLSSRVKDFIDDYDQTFLKSVEKV